MKNRYGLTAIALCAVLMISGCAENKLNTSASEPTESTTPAVTTASETKETTTAASGTAATTTAGTTETSGNGEDTLPAEQNDGTADMQETTTVTTTAASTTTTAATTTTTEESTTTVTGSALPDPVKDESIFTLYIGGGETCEKYDVNVDALPADILNTVVKELQQSDVVIALGKDSTYSLVDKDEAEMNSALSEAEKIVSRDSFEELKQYMTDTEYADMTYEKYRDMMLGMFEASYPGFSEKFDENGKIKVPDTTAEYITISYYSVYEDITPYCDNETVIKEGLKAAFTELKNNTERADMLKNGDTLETAIDLRYYGGYVLSYDVSFYNNLKPSYFSGNVYLGKAKVYENDPDLLTRQVFSAKSEALRYINDDDDSPYEMTIEIVSEGYVADAISIGKSGYANVMSNKAILGEIPEISFSSRDLSEDAIKEVWVEFRIKEGYRDNVLGTYAAEEPELEGIGRLNVFMYFTDGNMTLPIQTYFDKDNYVVYTVTDMIGTYCLYDLEIWLDMLDIPPQ